MQRFKKLVKSLNKYSQDEKIVLMRQIEYAYKIFRLVIYAVVVTYFLGCFWYMIIQFLAEDGYESEFNFIVNNNLKEQESYTRVIKCAYFALNTLSTVGYGDFSP